MAALIAIAATMKAIDRGLGQPFTIVIVVLEFAFSCWLLTTHRHDFSRIALMLSFSVFAIIAWYKHLIGESSCGCFVRVVVVTPLLTAACDAAVVMLLLFVRSAEKAERCADFGLSHVFQRFARFSTLVLMSGALLTLASRAARPPDELSHPTTWRGKAFPLDGYLSPSAKLSTGDWLLVLHRPDCSSCEGVLAQLRTALAGDSTVSHSNVATIDLSGQSRIVRGFQSLSLGRQLDSESTQVWETPVLIAIQDGIVQSVAQGHDSLELLREWNLVAGVAVDSTGGF